MHDAVALFGCMVLESWFSDIFREDEEYRILIYEILSHTLPTCYMGAIYE